MEQFLSLLLSLILTGLAMGLLYALYAIGLSLIYGVMRIVNFAHGEMYMIGGYALYYFTLILNVPSIVALPLVILVGFAVGYSFERTCIRPIYTGKVADPGNYSTIVTFGLVIFLQNLAIVLFGPWNYKPPSFLPFRIEYGFGGMEGDRVVGAIISLGIIVAMYLFLKKSWIGKAFQATAQNILGAQIYGVNPSTVSSLSFGLSAALAAAAGALLAPLYLVYPDVGSIPVIKAFIINVVGGLGSVPGCIVGGLILGLTETLLAVYVNPAYKNLYGFLVLVVMMAIRPYGLFGKPEGLK
jgi:branched-chain amino acid transport system permease protein